MSPGGAPGMPGGLSSINSGPELALLRLDTLLVSGFGGGVLDIMSRLVAVGRLVTGAGVLVCWASVFKWSAAVPPNTLEAGGKAPWLVSCKGSPGVCVKGLGGAPVANLGAELLTGAALFLSAS